jgi:TorA maturation chaperone TorD
MSATATSTVKFDAPRLIAPEDQARADIYALLASLFYRAPNERLLQAIVIAPEPEAGAGNEFVKAWRALAAASNVIVTSYAMDAVQDEYESIFVGVGRPPVMLYGSFYLAGFMMEKPLAVLRTDLAALGFTRGAGVSEPEDHVAAVCDVMRALILGDLNAAPAEVAAQKHFFEKHIKPWAFKCCTAVNEFEKTNYYKKVAAFADAFFRIEAEAFEMA